jgi:DNA-binding FadR family transcriptional regulator
VKCAHRFFPEVRAGLNWSDHLTEFFSCDNHPSTPIVPIPMPLTAVHPNRLYRQIARQLSRLIAAGEFARGERLPGERELAQRLGVSRSSVREAIVALEIAGEVEVRTGSGIYVTAGNPPPAAPGEVAGNSPFDVLRARLVVEAETARLAARHATPADLADITAAFGRLVEENDTERIDGDRMFHLRIARASGNPVLAHLVEQLWSERESLIWARLEELSVSPAGRRAGLEEHRAILAALERGDAAAAVRAMRSHLQGVVRRRLAIMKQPRVGTATASRSTRRG